MRLVKIFGQIAIILFLGRWAFAATFRGEWLFDDVPAILDNRLMHGSDGVWSIWFAPPGPDYFPLKDSVQWVQWHLFGDATLGYHLTNVVLHFVSVLLVWRLLAVLGVRLAWVGGLVFALHPCTVESVAWICELKNTLSLPLLLMAMLAYIRHDREGDRLSYFIAAAAFLASLLCKTSGVMFPAILLLYAWWRHGRIRARDWKKSAPFFVLSFALGLATIAFQHHVPAGGEAIASLDPLSRFLCAGLSIAFYIAKVFLPVNLDIVYFRWDVHAASGWEIFCWLLIVTSVVWLATRSGAWARHALLGYLFFLINLLPVLGFVRMTWTHYAWVADHFLYLPMIGLIGVAVAALSDAYTRHKDDRLLISVGVALYTLFLTYQTHEHDRAFNTSFSLWETNLMLNPQSWLGRNNFAVALAANGDAAGAVRQIELSLQINPNQSLTYINLGNVLVQMGKIPEAIAAYNQAITLRPESPLAHYQAARAFAQQEEWDHAIEQYRLAVRYNPLDATAYSDLAAILLQTGHSFEAREEAEKAVGIDPNYSDARYNLALALEQEGRTQEAMTQFEVAARLSPTDAQSQYNLGVAYLQAGRNEDALMQFQKTLKIDPRYGAARAQLERLQSPSR